MVDTIFLAPEVLFDLATPLDKMRVRHVLEGLGLIVIVGLLVLLYYATARTQYESNFEMVPAKPELVLDCEGNQNAWWAEARGSTDMCIFTGDFTQAQALSERQVRQLCTERPDCGGYLVRTVSAPLPCEEGQASPYTCLQGSYNNGQPEYVLLPVSAASNLVTAPNPGHLRATRTATHVRKW